MIRKNQDATLFDLACGRKSYVHGIHGNGLMRRRLLDLGFVPGAEVEKLYRSPAGDPTVYRIRETSIALRDEDAREVRIGPEPTGIGGCSEESRSCGRCAATRNGRNGRMTRPTADDHQFIVALAGNPNTGKSTVFNKLTGFRQHVGNWPGKTVTRAEGTLINGQRRFKLVDLPGTYSLLSTSIEEEIARDFILFGAPDCTVVVADATCLERNLNLVFQILEITDRAVVCVNLMDEARRKRIAIDGVRLEEELGVPVVLTAARRGEGLAELKSKVEGVATGSIETSPARIPFDPKLEKAMDEIVPLIERIYPDLPNARWIALRLIDGGDRRLREEIENGVLADLAGRIGGLSLTGMAPDSREIKR